MRFYSVHFLKAHKNGYIFYVRPMFGGFLTNVTSKFTGWQKSFVLIRGKVELCKFSNE